MIRFFCSKDITSPGTAAMVTCFAKAISRTKKGCVCLFCTRIVGFEHYKLKFSLALFGFVNSFFLSGAHIFTVMLFSESYCTRNEKYFRLLFETVRCTTWQLKFVFLAIRDITKLFYSSVISLAFACSYSSTIT